MVLLNRLLDILYPPKCVFCGKILEPAGGFVCKVCKEKLPYTRGAEIKRRGEFFDFCLAPLYYRGSVRDSILDFKFGNRPGRAEGYAALISECAGENLDVDIDLITWAPISKKRFRKRGYDQSRLIALSVAKALGKPAVKTLDKHTDIPAQSSISDPARRRANVMDVYAAVEPENFKGKRVLLIDDIITTGATMSECARTLLMAGAERVIGACIARAD